MIALTAWLVPKHKATVIRDVTNSAKDARNAAQTVAKLAVNEVLPVLTSAGSVSPNALRTAVLAVQNAVKEKKVETTLYPVQSAMKQTMTTHFLTRSFQHSAASTS